MPFISGRTCDKYRVTDPWEGWRESRLCRWRVPGRHVGEPPQWRRRGLGRGRQRRIRPRKLKLSLFYFNFCMFFMSFCCTLSTLCSQVVFHSIPHFGKRAGQKVQRKIAVAVQNVKPLYFLSRSFALSHFPTKICWAILYVFIITLTKEPRRRVWRWRIREGEIGDGEIWEGGCE